MFERKALCQIYGAKKSLIEFRHRNENSVALKTEDQRQRRQATIKSVPSFPRINFISLLLSFHG